MIISFYYYYVRTVTGWTSLLKINLEVDHIYETGLTLI